jgi:ketosteroid isomerase-like protein
MSELNVEILRRSNKAFNDGDLDAFVDFLAPDAELRDLANAPDQSHVITVRDGRAARTVEFMDRAEALEAAGLSE